MWNIYQLFILIRFHEGFLRAYSLLYRMPQPFETLRYHDIMQTSTQQGMMKTGSWGMSAEYSPFLPPKPILYGA